MEELKILVEMVSNLPTMAVWVLCGYLIYKVAIIGSVYGLIRFFIEKTHSWLTTEKTVKWNLDGISINNVVKHRLVNQLQRIKSTTYLHNSDIDILENALNEYLSKQKK